MSDWDPYVLLNWKYRRETEVGKLLVLEELASIVDSR